MKKVNENGQKHPVKSDHAAKQVNFETGSKEALYRDRQQVYDGYSASNYAQTKLSDWLDVGQLRTRGRLKRHEALLNIYAGPRPLSTVKPWFGDVLVSY